MPATMDAWVIRKEREGVRAFPEEACHGETLRRERTDSLIAIARVNQECRRELRLLHNRDRDEQCEDECHHRPWRIDFATNGKWSFMRKSLPELG